jgi:hypothetical protein
MYQSLIWPAMLSHDPRGLRSPLDAEDMKSLPDPLIDGMWRDLESRRDLFR